MKLQEIINEDFVDCRNIGLPIGSAKAKGPIENFVITIYDHTGRKYMFKVNGGNICGCENDSMADSIKYEVH